MKHLPLLLAVILCGCAAMPKHPDFTYREIDAPAFTLAAWVKQTDPQAPFHIYIEGDGRAFNNSGMPSKNPTPKNSIMQKMAFKNPAANVAYIARPCQFVKEARCSQKDWTTARFSPKAVASEAYAIQKIAGDREVFLYGYSGGALISGLVINNYPEIKVKHWITYAGLLNHESWTEHMRLQPLTGSLDLKDLPAVPQSHFAGAKDKVIPLKLIVLWTDNKNLTILPKATHTGPFPSFAQEPLPAEGNMLPVQSVASAQGNMLPAPAPVAAAPAEGNTLPAKSAAPVEDNALLFPDSLPPSEHPLLIEDEFVPIEE